VRYLFSDNSKEIQDSEVLIVLTPHIVRLPSITAENLKTMAAGTDSVVRVYHEDEEAAPAGVSAPAKPVTTPPPGVSPGQSSSAAAQLRFEPANVTLKQGDTTTLALAVSNVNDLSSIPLLIHYDPAVLQVQEVRDGGFLSGGTQEIAIVQRIDQQKGEVVVSSTRQPNTPGVNGSGTLLGIVVRGLAPGKTALQILEVNARDSKHAPIPMVSGEATIQVQ